MPRAVAADVDHLGQIPAGHVWANAVDDGQAGAAGLDPADDHDSELLDLGIELAHSGQSASGQVGPDAVVGAEQPATCLPVHP